MVFDGHSDIFTDITARRLNGETQVFARRHAQRLKAGQIEGACCVVWIDPPYTSDPPRRMEEILRSVTDEMKECTQAVFVDSTAAIAAARQAGKFYILPGIEGLSAIGEDLDQIDRLYAFGARHAMLTWNESNALATGVLGSASRGLTPTGKRAARKIQDLHMLLDVSHANEATFWDIMRQAVGPVIASHSDARALTDVPRNLSDEQLLAVRDTGGIVGLNAFTPFIDKNPAAQTTRRLIQHAAHIADKIGTEYLAFGFDFCEFLPDTCHLDHGAEGRDVPLGLEDCSHVPAFLEQMREAGFSSRELEQISNGNWLRLIQRVIG